MLLQYGATFFEDIFATFAISPKTVLDFFQNLAKLAATFTTLIFGGVKMGKVAKISTYQHFFETWCQKEVGEVAKVLINIAFEKSDPYVYTL